MAKFKPSKFQSQIFSFIEEGKGNGMVKAVAGSGKTTTLVQALKLIDPSKSVLFLAFNKSIAVELQRRVPDHVQAKTMNSLGHSAWMRSVGHVELDANKSAKILVEEGEEEFGRQAILKARGAVKKLVGYAKGIGIAPTNSDLFGLETDTYETWEKIALHHGLQIPEKMSLESIIMMARFVLSESVKSRKLIDFDDQLYLPILYGVPFQRKDWVFVDEVQDLNPIQCAILARCRKPKGRILAVGDEKQAIYGFRGADSEAMEKIRKEFKCKDLPLSITYRCPTSVVDLAKTIVPEIEAAEGAPAGLVTHIGLAADQQGRIKTDHFKPRDLVVCRNVAPLVRVAYSLLRDRKAVDMMGRDFGKTLISFIQGFKISSIKIFLDSLAMWAETEKHRLQLKDPDADLSIVTDKLEVIHVFMEMSNPTSVDALIHEIESIFTEGGVDATKLATIHRAKGLEADRVIFLDSWRVPSKFAKKPWQLTQEKNLEYVAITRAKKELIFLDTEVPH